MLYRPAYFAHVRRDWLALLANEVPPWLRPVTQALDPQLAPPSAAELVYALGMLIGAIKQEPAEARTLPPRLVRILYERHADGRTLGYDMPTATAEVLLDSTSDLTQLAMPLWMSAAHRFRGDSEWDAPPDLLDLRTRVLLVPGEGESQPLASPAPAYTGYRPAPAPVPLPALFDETAPQDLVLAGLGPYLASGRGTPYWQGDLYRLGMLGMSLSHAIRIDIDDLAAWLDNRTDLKGLDTRARNRLRQRAWHVVRGNPWWEMDPETGAGCFLLNLHQYGNTFSWHPWAGWEMMREKRMLNHHTRRFSGALTHFAERQPDRSTHPGLLLAAMEEMLQSGRQRNQRGIPHLCIPERGKTGPGPVVTLTGEQLLARAGLWAAKHRARVMRLARIRERLEGAGYFTTLPGEAAAGDTVEIVAWQTGRNRHAPVRISFRATARLCAALAVGKTREEKRWKEVSLHTLLRPRQS